MSGCASLPVTSTETGKATFHPGKRVRHQANHDARLRKRLQHKGERFAKRRKKRRRKRNGKGTERVSPKARQANRVYSQWSFAELHALISYKAALSGALAIKVDADYTSQACPLCGHTSDDNRPKKGLLFVCQKPECRYTLHADLIGARNVTLRTLLVRQDWTSTGYLSTAPDASDKEAKAARLLRYAELRWSPEVTQASG